MLVDKYSVPAVGSIPPRDRLSTLVTGAEFLRRTQALSKVQSPPGQDRYTMDSTRSKLLESQSESILYSWCFAMIISSFEITPHRKPTDLGHFEFYVQLAALFVQQSSAKSMFSCLSQACSYNLSNKIQPNSGGADSSYKLLNLPT